MNNHYFIPRRPIIKYLGVILCTCHCFALAPAAKHEQQDNLNDDDDVHNDEKSKYSNYLNHDNDIELM